MLKNLCQLEHIVSDKVCRFVCDHDTDINIIKEALFQFQKYIGAVEDAAKAQQEQKEEQKTCLEPIHETIEINENV